MLIRNQTLLILQTLQEIVIIFPNHNRHHHTLKLRPLQRHNNQKCEYGEENNNHDRRSDGKEAHNQLVDQIISRKRLKAIHRIRKDREGREEDDIRKTNQNDRETE